MNEAPRFQGRRLLLISCAVALSLYHLIAAAVMYPVPGGDAVVFMPAAINQKAGRGLTNSLWAVHADPTGRHRYLEHPSLFPLLVSVCMWKPETKNAFLVLAIFNALSLTLYAAVLCCAQFTRRLIASPVGFTLMLLSIIGVAFFVFNDAEGRPEALTTLLLSLGMAALVCLPHKWWPVCAGIVIGVAAAIHPVHGIIIACLALLVFLSTAPRTEARPRITVAAAIALPLCGMLFFVSPYPIGETIRAISSHAVFANSPDYRLSTLAVFYLKLAPWSGVYLLGILLLLLWTGVYFWRGCEVGSTRWVQMAALFLTGLVFWFFSVRRPSAAYYVTMIAPAAFAGALYLAAAGRARPTGHWMAVIFFSLFPLCLGRDAALFANYKMDGVSFTAGQKAFGQLLRSTDQVISVSESFWVLTNEFERIRLVERGSAAGDLMFLQQAQRGSLSPPRFPGYRLVAQSFISRPPQCFGRPIGRTMPGYSFAVFTREMPLAGNFSCSRHGE